MPGRNVQRAVQAGDHRALAAVVFVAALWVLIGLLWTLISFWMDPGMWLAHTLEVLADATIYVGVLVALFAAREPIKAAKERELAPL